MSFFKQLTLELPGGRKKMYKPKNKLKCIFNFVLNKQLDYCLVETLFLVHYVSNMTLENQFEAHKRSQVV